MSTDHVSLKRIALWAFLLNMVWEFAQCTVLYDMWAWGVLRAGLGMLGAILGDVFIVLGVVGVSTVLVGRGHVFRKDLIGWTALLSVGFVASIGLEWAARALDLWGYTDAMPTIELLGHTVGLSPIAQVTMLPAISVYLAASRTSSNQNLHDHG